MKKIKVIIPVCLLLILLLAIYRPGKSNTVINNQKVHIKEDSISVYAENLIVPWSLVFLPDGRMLVSERIGEVLVISKNNSIKSKTAVSLNMDLPQDSEGGLLGIALHPKFISNHFVYLYYSYKNRNNETKNRVSRMTFIKDTLSDEHIIIDNIPGNLYHNGGRIKFGPDGYLYITTGDAQNPKLAQDKASLAGKILRVTDEGKAAGDNPFNNLTYSYGHRNPQGLAWDANGNLWATEHGRSNPSGFDEINIIKQGKNYGWDIIEGDETQPGMEMPVLNSGADNTWAPAGAVFAGNSLFFTGLRGEALYEAVIKDNKIISLKEHLKHQYGRLRDVIIGPDHMLYIATSNLDGRGNPLPKDDKIIKVDPSTL